MGKHIKKKKNVTQDVYSLALERIHVAYELYDTIAVSFSGGKDSTACLNLALKVARDLGRLPLEVFHYDEEAIPFETEHYVRRVAQREDVRMRWLCLPVRHRNGCNRKSPYWYPWAPEDEDKWVRPLPPEAITYDEVPGFPVEPDRRPTVPESVGLLFPPNEYGRVGSIMGIRGDESLIRMTAMLRPNNPEGYNFIRRQVDGQKEGFNRGNVYKVYPIYDWRTADVWLAPQQQGWDYNVAYDLMDKAGMSLVDQRVAPPYGEEPLGNLWMYGVCFPDVWDRMQRRVPGAATAARYSRTSLYSFNDVPALPDGFTWEEWVSYWVNKHPEPYRTQVGEVVRSWINYHYNIVNEPILPSVRHPDTGVCWRFLLNIAVRGDFKGRRIPMKAPLDNIAPHRKRYDDEWRLVREGKEVRADAEAEDEGAAQDEGRFI